MVLTFEFHGSTLPMLMDKLSAVYHFSPKWCRALLWRYCEGPMATVMIGDKQTPWCRFGIGVFPQSCSVWVFDTTLIWYRGVSTVLFNVGFNTTFAHLAPFEDDCA